LIISKFIDYFAPKILIQTRVNNVQIMGFLQKAIRNKSEIEN